jgi:hypothetical protein
LDGIPVTGDDEHPISLFGTLRRQGRQDVVSLVILFTDRGDIHGQQRFFEQWNLADELGRRLTTSSLVFGVFARAKRIPGDVEGHSQMSWLLLLQETDQHGDKTMDRVSVLAFAIPEAIERKGIKRTESE